MFYQKAKENPKKVVINTALILIKKHVYTKSRKSSNYSVAMIKNNRNEKWLEMLWLTLIRQSIRYPFHLYSLCTNGEKSPKSVNLSQ